MAYLTVTTQFDVVDPGDGQLSLREAVAQANTTPGADTIRFVAALEGQTLVLTGGELVVSQDLTIDGRRRDDSPTITIDADHKSRVLAIVGNKTKSMINDIVVTGGESGYAGYGAGIYVGTGAGLVLDSCIVRDNESGIYGAGGGIFGGPDSVLTITDSLIEGNSAYENGGAIFLTHGSELTIQQSTIKNNRASYGGAVSVWRSAINISYSAIIKNYAADGGGLEIIDSRASIADSSIANNTGRYFSGYGGGHGAGINALQSSIRLANSTISGNIVRDYDGPYAIGGGIHLSDDTFLSIVNSVIAGNSAITGPDSVTIPSDVAGVIGFTDGHNVFGSKVKGSIPGDREKVPASVLFAAIDPATGGGKLSPSGIVPLKKNLLSNPALSGADPLTASRFGQLGTTKRPLPAGSLPDIGAVEADQKLSTSPTVANDVLTGSNAANNLAGMAGNDFIRGLGGNDTLNGGDGSDLLDGGPGNDKLNGGTGVDVITYAGATAVVVDLSTTPATARRGGETDTLTAIEGAVGSNAADTFKGDVHDNEFQGGPGKDSYTGGAGRDMYDFNAVADSPVGANRDVIKDFTPGQDVIDVAGIDADGTIPGDQSFRWVGKATLTGAAQLGYYVSGGTTVVRASTDADTAAEVEIQLTGTKTLTEGDFRF